MKGWINRTEWVDNGKYQGVRLFSRGGGVYIVWLNNYTDDLDRDKYTKQIITVFNDKEPGPDRGYQVDGWPPINPDWSWRRERFAEMLIQLRDMFPVLTLERECEFCQETMEVESLVVHLNDEHLMNRQYIAELLDDIEGGKK